VGHLPDPPQFGHFSWSEFSATFWPVPKHCLQSPDPPQSRQRLRLPPRLSNDIDALGHNSTTDVVVSCSPVLVHDNPAEVQTIGYELHWHSHIPTRGRLRLCRRRNKPPEEPGLIKLPSLSSFDLQMFFRELIVGNSGERLFRAPGSSYLTPRISSSASGRPKLSGAGRGISKWLETRNKISKDGSTALTMSMAVRFGGPSVRHCSSAIPID
jgi:hypothetical protein